MRAAWYERQGSARDVLSVGEMDEPRPLAGEVRVRVAASGVNPGDVKKRQDAFGYWMPYPRVVPHSDDVPAGAKVEAARAVNEVLEAGWEGLEIADRFPLDEIARAHEAVEHPTKAGRVVITI